MHEGDSAAPGVPLIVTTGLRDRLSPHDLHEFAIVEAADAQDTVRFFHHHSIAVLVLGDRLAPTEAQAILSRSLGEFPNQSPANIVIGAGSSAELFQAFIDRGTLFYLSRGPLAGTMLHSIIRAAARRFQTRAHGPTTVSAGPDRDERVLDFYDRLPLQTELASAARLAVEAIQNLLQAERAQCLIFDPNEETLRRGGDPDRDDRAESAVSGLAGFVVRTGERIALETVGSDPRCELDVDDPGGSAHARFIAEPIVGVHGATIGLLTASRDQDSPRFSDRDAHTLELLAHCAGPVFTRLTWQAEIQESLVDATHGQRLGAGFFRREALDHNARGWEQQGQLIRAIPPWLKPTYWTMLVLFIAGLLWTILGLGK
jgi:hypothetical protein